MKRKKISEADIARVFEKTNGHCAYCGKDLKRGSQKIEIDHAFPIYYGGDNSIRNLLLSCPQCNNFKHSFSIEELRNELLKQIDRARRYSVNFRFAEKYGLIEIKENKIEFYFEKIKLNPRPIKDKLEYFKETQRGRAGG